MNLPERLADSLRACPQRRSFSVRNFPEADHLKIAIVDRGKRRIPVEVEEGFAADGDLRSEDRSVPVAVALLGDDRVRSVEDGRDVAVPGDADGPGPRIVNREIIRDR